MSDDGFFGNMPYLATMPSCAFYLRGSNGSNILDWSNNHVTVTNVGASNSTNAYYFPPKSIFLPNAIAGDSKVVYVPYSGSGNSNNNLGSNNFLLSFWVNLSYNSWNSYGMQVDQISSGGFGSVVVTALSGKWQVFMTSNGSSWDLVNGVSLGSSSTGSWVNIIVTRIGGSAYGYLNGSQTTLSTSLGSTALYNGSGITSLGNDGTAASAALGGYMDEACLFNGVNGTIPTASQIYNFGISRKRMIVG
jgi:hypothetical protein